MSIKSMVMDNLNRIFPSLNITDETTDAELDEKLSKLPSLEEMTDNSNELTKLKSSISTLTEDFEALTTLSATLATKEEVQAIKAYDDTDIQASIKAAKDTADASKKQSDANAEALLEVQGKKSTTDQRSDSNNELPAQESVAAFNKGVGAKLVLASQKTEK